MTPTPNDILHFDRISKSFFGVPVIREVSFTLPRASTLGLVGENGAGKSTLMNILGGVLQPDAGQMLLDNQPYSPRDPRDAARAGVSFIHQELNLFANLTIAENLHLPDFPRRRLGPIPLPLVDRATMRRRAAELLSSFALDKHPDTPLERLSPGEAQLVEIAKAVGVGSRIIILDEPTTSLTSREAHRLFDLMARLRTQGVSMIYISHNLADVMRLCDHVVVLRDGQVAGQGATGEVTTDRMISLMVGRSIEQLFPTRQSRPSTQPILQVENLSRADSVRDVSLTLHKGDILGLAGLMGAGRTELLRLIFGADKPDSGRVLLHGQSIRPSPTRSIRQSLAFLTENRRQEGLLLEESITANAALAFLRTFASTPARILRRKTVAAGTRPALSSVHLTGASSLDQPVRTLSGGNQQKVVLAKWLVSPRAVLLLDEPTRGIDVAAKHEVYRIINDLADNGVAILLVSSELEELIGLCDRILVMAAGRITASIDRPAFDRESILKSAFAAGAQPLTPA